MNSNGVDTYALAPYVKVFRADSAAFVGVGSAQRRIDDERLFGIYVRTLHFLKSPRALQEIKDFVGLFDLDARERADLDQFLFASGTLIQCGVVDKDERFSRHRLFYNLAGSDPDKCQSNLMSSKVLILGCGGIGTMVSTLLVAAGVRTLTLLDGDAVEESNLTRQVVFNEVDIGEPKTQVLARKLINLDKEVTLTIHDCFISDSNARSLISGHDVVVLSADYPFGIARIINRAAIVESVPFINAGYIGDVATVGPFVIPGRSACLECSASTSGVIFGGSSLDYLIREIHADHQAASFGPVNAIASSMAVNDVIRHLTGMGRPLSENKRIGFFTNKCQFDQISYVKNAACTTCSHTPESALTS